MPKGDLWHGVVYFPCGFPQIPLVHDDFVHQRRDEFRETLSKRATNANDVRDKFLFDVRSDEGDRQMINSKRRLASNSRLEMTSIFH